MEIISCSSSCGSRSSDSIINIIIVTTIQYPLLVVPSFGGRLPRCSRASADRAKASSAPSGDISGSSASASRAAVVTGDSALVLGRSIPRLHTLYHTPHEHFYLMNIYLPHEQAGIYDVNHLAEREEVAISPSPIIRDNTTRLSLKCAIFNAGISKTESFSRARSCRGIRRGKKILSSISRNARDPPALPFWGTAVPVTCSLKHIS